MKKFLRKSAKVLKKGSLNEEIPSKDRESFRFTKPVLPGHSSLTNSRPSKDNLSESDKNILSTRKRKFPVQIPEKFGAINVRTASKLFPDRYLVSIYKETGSIVVTDFLSGNYLTYENPHEILCRLLEPPYIITYHLNGMFQIINVNTNKVQKIMDPDFKNESKKPNVLLQNESCIVMIYPNKVKIFSFVNDIITFPPKEIHLEGQGSSLHSIQQKFSQLRFPRLLICSVYIAQIWDLEKGNLLFEGKNDQTTSTWIHVGWGEENLFTATNHLVTVFNFNQPNQPGIQYKQNSILTSLFMSPAYCITGDKYGLVEYRQAKTGKVLYSLNTVTYGINEADSVLGRKVNKLSLLFRDPHVWVISAHEDGKINVWNVDKKKQSTPIDSVVFSESVKDFFIKGEEIFFAVGNSEGGSPVVYSWIPVLEDSEAPSFTSVDKDLIRQAALEAHAKKEKEKVSEAVIEAVPEFVLAPENKPVSFGYPLEQLPLNPESGLPTIIDTLLCILEKKALSESKIFERLPSEDKVKAIIVNINQQEEVNFDTMELPIVAALIAEWFKLLPEAILTSDFYKPLIDVSLLNSNQRRAKVTEIWDQIPSLNKNVLTKTLLIFGKMAFHKDETMATASSLGLIFGKFWLRPAVEDRKSELQIPQRAAIGRTLIELIGMKDFEVDIPTKLKPLNTLVSSTSFVQVNHAVEKNSPTPKQNFETTNNVTPNNVNNISTNTVAPKNINSELNVEVKGKKEVSSPQLDEMIVNIPTIQSQLMHISSKLEQWRLELNSTQESYVVMVKGADIRDVTMLIVDEIPSLGEKSSSKVSLQLKGKLINTESERQKMGNLRLILNSSLNQILDKLNSWKILTLNPMITKEHLIKFEKIQKILDTTERMYFL